MGRSDWATRKSRATPMSKPEMVEMVSILEKMDYDGKLANYDRPNARKDGIMDKVVACLVRKFGVERSKDQIRKRWSDLKHREQDQLSQIHRILKKSKFYFFFIFLIMQYVFYNLVYVVLTCLDYNVYVKS